MLPLLLLSLLPAARADDAPRWTVQVDPLTALLGYPHVQVERALAPPVSVYLGPHLRLYDPPWATEHEPYRGFGLEAGVRWFPWQRAPAGPWVCARGVLAHLRTTEGALETGLGGYGSALVGYTWIPWGRLVLSGGAGVQYLHYSVGGYGPTGVFPAAHTAIGVAF
ncbi:MAG: DUF3575 domain-containing protein [Alphaproteobacteria bacterium]|nr:DUF3575 domain-containing protein [Alphaproteobacteria bacterium]